MRMRPRAARGKQERAGGTVLFNPSLLPGELAWQLLPATTSLLHAVLCRCKLNLLTTCLSCDSARVLLLGSETTNSSHTSNPTA